MVRLHVIALIAIATASAHAAPYTVALSAVEDAFVWEDSASSSHGRAGALAVAGSTATNAAGAAQGIYDSFVKFDASALTAAMDAEFGAGRWAVRDATLSVVEDGDPRNSRFNRGAGAFEIRWLFDDSWVEGSGGGGGQFPADGVTYDTAPTFLSPALDASLGAAFANAGADGSRSFALELPGAFVADLLAGGDVGLYVTAIDPAVGFTFFARDYGEAGTVPTLTITADLIPEPTTLALLGGALATLARRRRAPGGITP
ncbi:PEP-CTERM sorting domain-containing protein [bacterium]|nr:PEP-CTERM sorting domain-containing protein [bacterium]